VLTLTTQMVKAFEADQQAHGTGVAIYNLLWQKAADDLRAIGVRRVTTVARPSPMRGRLPLANFKKLKVNRGTR